MLLLSFLLDAGGPLLLLFVGLPIVLIALLIVVGVEAALLHALKWDSSFGRCLSHSLAINAISALPGCALLYLVQAGLLSDASAAGPFAGTLFTLLPFVAAFVLSFLIEGLVLRALKRDGERPFAKSLAINVVSYVILAAFALVVANL